MENSKKNQEDKSDEFSSAIEALIAASMLGAIDANVQHTGESMPKHTAELRIDTEHVSITVSHYEELIQAKSKLDILERAYFSTNYGMSAGILASVFGPKPGERNA